VSSDAFADLARGLASFSSTLSTMLDENRRPAPGSPADAEAAGEPFAGEWGATPSRDVFSTAFLKAWACADHLGATATVLRARSSVAAPYTLIRAASEAAAVAAYLTDPHIDARERVRRNMNCHLEGLGQDINLLAAFPAPEAATKVAEHRTQIDAVERTAAVHGFGFTPMKGFTPACVGTRQPSVMKLMDACVSHTPGLGAMYQRHLSSVAHSQLHGLGRFLMHTHNGTEANIPADEIARGLFAGPVCGCTLVERLCWFTGWNLERLEPAAVGMLAIWCRVTGGPQYPGPQRGTRVPAGFMRSA
jgi:hypothetical protein